MPFFPVPFFPVPFFPVPFFQATATIKDIVEHHIASGTIFQLNRKKSHCVRPPNSVKPTVAQKGHCYFSTIVCIFPAYYNFLKKHFDFFLLFPPGWKYFPPGWKVFQPGWKVLPPGWKVT